jgi:hypothetical protein
LKYRRAFALASTLWNALVALSRCVGATSNAPVAGSITKLQQLFGLTVR